MVCDDGLQNKYIDVRQHSHMFMQLVQGHTAYIIQDTLGFVMWKRIMCTDKEELIEQNTFDAFKYMTIILNDFKLSS